MMISFRATIDWAMKKFRSSNSSWQGLLLSSWNFCIYWLPKIETGFLTLLPVGRREIRRCEILIRCRYQTSHLQWREKTPEVHSRRSVSRCHVRRQRGQLGRLEHLESLTWTGRRNTIYSDKSAVVAIGALGHRLKMVVPRMTARPVAHSTPEVVPSMATLATHLRR